jgi:hypothetical protein
MTSKLEKRVERLETRGEGGFQETLNFLMLEHRLLKGPVDDEIRIALGDKARKLNDQGIFLSIARLLRKIDGKDLPRPGELRRGNNERH